MVVYDHNSSAGDVEADGYLGLTVQLSSGHSETLFQQTRWTGELAVLTEDPSSVPSTYI